MYKKTEQEVEVYQITFHNGRLCAIIFDKREFEKTGNGWKHIGLSKLLPIKTTIAAERIIPWKTIYTTSDGMKWDDGLYEKAIEHEIELMREEEENRNE